MDSKEDKNKPADSPPAEPVKSAAETAQTEPAAADSSGSDTQKAGLDDPAGGPAAGGQQPKEEQKLKVSIFRRFTESKWFYVGAFVIVIIIAAAAAYVSTKQAKNSSPNQTTTKSLTAQQLAALTNNTTTVGDAKQTLDVQSNSIFEGQVLLRQNLEVAGTLKVGGALSLPSITVGGTGSFGQLQVNNTLSVAGDGTIQGQLSVQKNLTVVGVASFGSLSASQINVTTLQLNGDLVINHHLIPNGSQPSRTNGTALGGGGTASVNGSDSAGTVTINTGSSPPAGCFATINFAQKFNSTPHVVISPSNSSSAGLDYYTNRSSTSFSICTINAPTDSTTYIFDYVAFD